MKPCPTHALRPPPSRETGALWPQARRFRFSTAIFTVQAALFSLPLLAADRIQFSDPSHNQAITNPVSIRPSFESLNQESSLGGVFRQSGEVNRPLSLTPNPRVHQMLNKRRDFTAGEKEPSRLPNIDELLNPGASLRNKNARDPFNSLEDPLPSQNPDLKSADTERLRETEAFLPGNLQRPISTPNLQFNTLIDGASDRPAIALPPPPASFVSGTIGATNLVSAVDKEKEKAKARIETFKQLIERPNAGIRSPNGLNGLDPINTAVDLTRESINPITPTIVRSGFNSPNLIGSGSVEGLGPVKSRALQEIDYRSINSPAASSLQRSKMNEPPRPRATANFLPVPKRAF